MVSDRAYLANARIGAELAKLNGEVDRLMAHFCETAQHIEPAALLPADVLIDLYGEDIRARAYTTNDPVEGELMLRPDFTVPVVQIHASSGDLQADYAYAGSVWRRQTPGSQRPTEYLQVGYESFGKTDEAGAEAEIFARFSTALSGAKTKATIGDVSLLFAIIDSLDTTDRRKAALRRHVWRPERFQKLLTRFSTPPITSEFRQNLFSADMSEKIKKLILEQGELVSLRSISEITDRVIWLKTEAETPRLSPKDLSKIRETMSLKCTVATAGQKFAAIAPDLTEAVENLENRAKALAKNGIDPARVDFDASYGLRTMEYYDGFVFGFTALNRPDLPQIAQGGRYDALTAILGTATPAVGGIVRPEALMALKGGAT